MGIYKCESKGVPVFTMESLEKSPYRQELEKEWANMLGHQLPTLPPFRDFWQELPSLFGWLEGGLAIEELPQISVAENEEIGWTPPSTVWTWGQKVPIETIRFAAANYLCVELGYASTKRLVEPYSLRRTKDGHLLLYAVKAQTGELRSYRIDRIESINVTNSPYKPRFAVEFTSTGILGAPPVQKSVSQGRTSSLGNRTVYVIECTYCGKQFKRSTNDTHLRPHKDKDAVSACPGRVGHEVNRYFE